LVKDTNDKWGQDSEHNVEKSQCPRLKRDLTGEVVEERKLEHFVSWSVLIAEENSGNGLTQNNVIYNVMFL